MTPDLADWDSASNCCREQVISEDKELEGIFEGLQPQIFCSFSYNPDIAVCVYPYLTKSLFCKIPVQREHAAMASHSSSSSNSDFDFGFDQPNSGSPDPVAAYAR